jgi:hypothetical protein
MSKKATPLISENTAFAIAICRKAFNDDNIDGDVYVNGVLSVISTFGASIQEVLRMRYRDNLTLREIGEKFDLSAERIRQIEMKINTKLKHPSRSQKMLVSKLISQNDALKNELTETKKLYLSASYRIKTMEKMLQQDELDRLDDAVEKWSIDNTPIEEMDLSLRLYNCLKKANIEYVGSIIELKTYSDIFAIKNLGRKCYHELLRVMEKLGYEKWVDTIKETK